MSRRILNFINKRPKTSLTISTGTTLIAYSIYNNFYNNNDDKNFKLPNDTSSLYYNNNTLRMESNPSMNSSEERLSSIWTPPTRSEMLKSLGFKSSVSSSISEISLDKVVKTVTETLTSSSSSVSGSIKEVNNNRDGEFDLLIVGGGATGAGIALDAAARGLRVGLVERDDFSSGKFVLSLITQQQKNKSGILLPTPIFNLFFIFSVNPHVYFGCLLTLLSQFFL